MDTINPLTFYDDEGLDFGRVDARETCRSEFTVVRTRTR